MNNFLYEDHAKVIFGQGCVKEYLASLLEGFGPNVLLAYGEGSIRRSGRYDQVRWILEKTGKQVTELPGIPSGPTWSKVLEGARLARATHTDLILAVGGGSVVDCGKAVSMAAVYEGDLWADFWGRQGVLDFDPLPLGAVITGPGVGSGMNGRAMITNEALGVKNGRNYPGCQPRFTLIDPTDTFSLPRDTMVESGFEVLSRLMEAYFSLPYGETSTDDLIEGLMRGGIRDLRTAAAAPEDYDIRSNLLWEAALAGNQLFRLGKRTEFSCQKLARRLALQTGRSCAACLAVLQPACYRQLCQSQTDKFVRFALRVWDISPEGRTRMQLAQAGLEDLEGFIRLLGLPGTFRELGLDRQEVTEQLAASPVPGFSKGELQDLLRQCG